MILFYAIWGWHYGVPSGDPIPLGVRGTHYRKSGSPRGGFSIVRAGYAR